MFERHRYNFDLVDENFRCFIKERMLKTGGFLVNNKDLSFNNNINLFLMGKTYNLFIKREDDSY